MLALQFPSLGGLGLVLFISGSGGSLVADVSGVLPDDVANGLHRRLPLA